MSFPPFSDPHADAPWRRLPMALLPLFAALFGHTLVADARPPLQPWDLPTQDAPGLLSADVLDIDEDAQGRLWFATAEGGASRYDPRDGSWLTLADGYGLHDTVVLDVHVDPRGDVWFATNDDGIHRFRPDDGSWARFDLMDDALDDAFRILEDRRGWLWVVGFDGGLTRYQPDEEHWVPLPDHVPVRDRGFHDIAEGADGTIWIQALDGLRAYDPGTGTWSALPELAPAVHGRLAAIHPDPDGGIWLGGWHGGVGWFEGQGGEYRQVVEPRERATEREVQALLRTRAGDLWIGTRAVGVLRLDINSGEWRDIGPRRDGEWGTPLLFEDSRGDLWAGAWNANVRRFDAEQRQWLDRQAPLVPPETGITAMHEDRRGNLWFGTRDAGVLRRDARSGDWTQLALRRDGLLGGDRANSVAAGRGGELWFTSARIMRGLYNGTGTHGGGIHRFDLGSGEWTTFRGDSGLDEPDARDVWVTPSGQVLAGGLFGIRRFEPDLERWTAVRYQAYSDPGYVRALVGTADGALWALGDPGRVVFAKHGIRDSWRAIPAHPTFAGRRVEWLTADPDGDLWAGLDGRFLAHLPRGKKAWECCTSTTRDGEAGIAGMSFGPTGQGWFWSSDGRVARWESEDETEWRSPPPWVKGRNNPGIALVDPHGAAWVGYHHGLVRFDADGERQDVFTPVGGFAVGMVGAGATDTTGGLWFAADGGGATRLVFDDRGPHRPLILDGFGELSAPSALMVGRSGAPGGVCSARPSGLMVSTPRGARTRPLSPARDWATAVAGAEDGCWAGHFLSGVVFVDREGSTRRFGTAEGLPDGLVLDLSPVPGSGGARVWVATNDGAALLDVDTGVMRTVAVEDGSSPGAVDRVLALPGGGALLVFNAFEIRWFLDPDAWPERRETHLRRVFPSGEVGPPMPLGEKEVRDLAVDGVGVIWLIADSFLFRLDGDALAPVPAPIPQQGETLRQVAADPTADDSWIWLALDAGFDGSALLLGHDPARGRWQTLTAADGIPAAEWIDMLEVAPGGELVILAGGQLVRGRVR